MEACADPAVVWLRTTGRTLVRKVAAETRRAAGPAAQPTAQARLAPYAHRATDVVMTYERGLLPLSPLGGGNRRDRRARRPAAPAPAGRRLPAPRQPDRGVAGRDDRGAVRRPRVARGYKRDADPWRDARADPREARRPDVRAAVAGWRARMCSRNDHCFDAMIAAYTAYLWARDGWPSPTAVRRRRLDRLAALRRGPRRPRSIR